MPDPTILAGIKVLAKYAASGVGSIAGPILASWRASREGKAELISADYRLKVRIIEAKAEAEALAIMSDAQQQVIQSVEQGVESAKSGIEITGAGIHQAIEFQTLKRTANISSVIEDAASELEDVEVQDHEPDPDWTARFFGHEQDVSSGELRQIWASILTSEIKSPGQTSLRTLDVLRNMTRREAEEFSAICSFVSRNEWIFWNESVFDIQGLEYSNLLRMQDCGLLDVDTGRLANVDLNSYGVGVLIQSNAHFLISHLGGQEIMIQVPAIRLTTAGTELSKIVTSTINTEYLSRFSTFLDSENCSLDYLEGVEQILGDGTIRYRRSVPIKPQNNQSSEVDQ